MSRVSEPVLSDRYAKDHFEENFLSLLNGHLADFERETYQDLDQSSPCIYVCGAPRSGTTLLTQVLSSCLDVQPINNLVASFWRAPCVGLRLSKKLLGVDFESMYESDYGRTADIREPHEFGYFWSEILGRRSMDEPTPEMIESVDWSNFSRVLSNMQSVAQRPIIFKAFMLAYYAERVCAVLDKSLFIYVRRDFVENCASVYRGRQEYVGSESSWYSVRPLKCNGVDGIPPLQQVVMQVHYINEALSGVWSRLPERNKLILDYSAFCESPDHYVAQVADALRLLGADVAIRGSIPDNRFFRPSKIDSNLRVSIESYLAGLSVRS